MSLPKLWLSFLLILSFSAYSQKNTSYFIRGFLPIAQNLQNKWGIPVSIILGVSILESGSGSSRNAKQLNNFFGVTGKNTLKTRKSVYKQYATAEDSFVDFCRIMSRKKFYRSMKNDPNYQLWLISMIKANYASAKSVWESRVQSVIQKHQLAKYDKLQSI